MTISRHTAAAILWGVVLTGLATAQDPAGAPTGTRRTLDEIRCGFSDVELKSNVVYLFEDVNLRMGDLQVRADTVVVWLAEGARLGAGASRPTNAASRPADRDAIIPPEVRQFVRELYAEGTVILREGDEVSHARAAFFDLEHDRGIVIDTHASYPLQVSSGQQVRLNIRADEMRFLAENRIEALGASATTCLFGHPHYHVASDRIEMYRERLAKPHSATDTRPDQTVPSIHYAASGNTLVLGDTPVMWLPDFAGDTGSPAGESTRFIKDVRFGSTNRFGRRVGVTIGDDIQNAEGKKWGSWGVLLDYMTKRGPGVGIDLAWKTEDYKGKFVAYYHRDHGTDPLFGDPPTPNRGRVSFQHRQKLPWEIQLDLEANLFSDRGYYRTFFESEFRNDKPPETYGYLKRPFENSAITALWLQRVNHFETTTEYAPKIDYTLVTQPLVDVGDNPLYLSTRAEVSRLTRRFDDDLAIKGERTWRVDVDNLLELPLFAGPVKITPFAGIRSTYYQTDYHDREDQVRTGFTYGAELATQAWRVFDIDGGLFGLDGLRHIVRPSVEYRRTLGAGLAPDDLDFYDRVDQVGNEETLTFDLRNVFQTIRHRKTGAAVDEVLDLDLNITWYPDSEYNFRGKPWGPLKEDGILKFSDELQLLADFEWPLSRARPEVFNAAVGYTPSDEFQTYLGFRHFDSYYDAVFNQISWRPTEKWLVRLYGSYDFNEGRNIEDRLALSRIGDDWVIEFDVRFDYYDHDYSFNVSFSPRALFNPVLQPRSLRSEPRLHYLGSELHR